jgi:hypothetical protein
MYIPIDAIGGKKINYFLSEIMLSI